MADNTGKILLAHGSGGRLSHEFVGAKVLKELGNPILAELTDSAVLDLGGRRLALTTDSHTVKPLFFPGGDIGRLSVCGTVNDLAAVGARPRYLTLGLVMEEGLESGTIERVLKSVGEAAREAGVWIVAGDTKVVEKGGADRLFTTTAGLGEPVDGADLSAARIKPGDKILVTGTIGDHGAAVLSSQQELGFSSLRSDVAPLWGLVEGLFSERCDVKFMRDPTRGGLATVLNEASRGRDFGLRVFESEIPVSDQVRAFSEILGLDPLYIANEGKMVIVVSPRDAERALGLLRAHPLGRQARLIGEAVAEPKGKVFLSTTIGGSRVLDMLVGDQFPRIC